MGITVREMLEIPNLKDLKVLAGEGGLCNEVVGITLFDAPDGYKWLKQGEFVFTTGYPFLHNSTNHKLGLLHLFEELIKKNTSGVGIKVSRYLGELPAYLLEYANDHNFPVVSIPNEFAWSDVTVPIIIDINKQQQAIIERSHLVYEQFLEYLLNGGDLEQLSLLLYQTINQSITIYLLSKEELVSVPQPAAIPKNNLISLLEKEYKLFNQNGLLHFQKRNNLVIRWIVREGQWEGAIIIWNCHLPLKPWEKVAIEQTAAIVSLELERANEITNTLQKFKDELITTLVQGTEESTNTLIRRAQQVGWDLSANAYQVAIVQFETNHKKELTETLYRHISYTYPQVLIGFDPLNGLILLIPNQMNIIEEEKLEDLFPEFNPSKVLVGVGRVSNNLHQIPNSYQEANQCIKILKKQHFEHPTEIQILLFSKLTVERILLSENPRKEAQKLVNNYISKIIDHDRKKNGELFHTLTTFIKKNGNYSEVAKALFVHKNTVRYRLETIHSLTGLNPEKMEDQILFRIALAVFNFSEYKVDS